MAKIGEKQEKILNSRVVWIVSICAAILMTVLVSMSFWYIGSLDEKTFEERKLHLMEFTEKVSEIMQETVHATWKEVTACEYILSKDSDSITSGEELLAELTSMTAFEDVDETLVLTFDDNGKYYSSDGHSGLWSAKTLLDMVGPEGTQTVITMPDKHSQDEEYLLFLDKLDEAVYMPESGIRLTHLAIAINTASLSRQLSLSGFSDECYSYIINSDGNKLYRYANDDNFIRGDNVIEAVSMYYVTHGGSFKDFEKAVKSETSTALEFRYVNPDNGQRREWFVANANIIGIGWEIVLFVPTDVLGANTDDILSSMEHFFIALSLVVMGILVLTVFVILANRADKRIIREKEESNALLVEAVKKAENASVAKSDFLSRMSHDIRTPINGIMGMTGIALKHLDDNDKVKDCLIKIDSSSKHLFRLINDVLDMSRIESGKTTLVVQAFNLRECLDSCADIIEGQLTDRNIELVRDFDKITEPYVFGDELHLRQVFINVLGNAVKFTRDGGKIYFKAKPVELNGKPAFRFRIQDTGIGMKQEYIPHIFEPFSQEDGGARTTYKGTGLGMAIVKQFVDMMGGTIEVESVLNAGTRFEIKIPMEADENAQKIAEQKVDADEVINLKGMKILLVEDNELNLEIAQDLLAEQGVNVTTARNGKFAVEAFKSTDAGTFDVILMDIMMPVMDGIEATKAIRALDRSDAKTIPIIAMTANAYDEDIKKTHEAGMNAHLSKPIDVPRLYAQLAECYRQKL